VRLGLNFNEFVLDEHMQNIMGVMGLISTIFSRCYHSNFKV